jgi:hypothetical protein
MTTQPLSPLTMLLSRHTRRREFITLLGGAAATWPLTARAQQPAKAPKIGYLGFGPASAYATRVEALRAGLRDLSCANAGNDTSRAQAVSRNLLVIVISCRLMRASNRNRHRAVEALGPLGRAGS